ncbi:hypothetical protein QYE76_036746 [Lolium multiflorum]|uniref:RNase H type-1 domain-containing protein n=1 Tax=Lolium multiflorum TaxID=4521 RepID=A0AAD8R1K4_LOLMU|nr:hypothetical protein QYE76_036746 [Lolium multiflorum]
MQQQQQLPPPPPLTGANALPVQPQPNRQQYQQVNRVEQNNDQPPPPAPLGRNVYEDPHLCMVVFVTEPMDRQSVHRRSMEVNAVMPAVPKYMLWASNNVAEYEALIHGLKVAKEIGALRIICYGDSDLVVQQCSGDWDAKDANMASYRFHVQKIAGFFEGCEFHHVPRAENEAADTLSKLGSSRQEIPPGIALAHLRVPSIKPSPESESIFVPESHVVPMEIDEGNPGTTPANSGAVNSGTATPIPEEAMLVDSMDIDMPVFVVREAPSWVEPIKEFLINGTLPVDENESRRIQRRSKAYTIINGEVYKRSVTGVLQRCVEPEEEEKCSRKFIEENAGTTLLQGRW